MFMLEMTAMLLFEHIKVLVLAWAFMLIGGLGHNWHNLCGNIMLTVVQLLRRIRLHFKNKMTSIYVGLRGAECGGVRIEGSVVGLVPPARVKILEVIAPVEIKALSLVVECVCLNVIVEDVPGHIRGVEALAPGIECRRPEVHHHRLAL